MKHTETLLSITNLKKYFPVAGGSLLKRQQLYVRANEEITLDIRAGETFGLVGESGCGKSTLGRTILQLYDQTAGSTVYYGRTIEEFVPRYVIKTLKNAKKMVATHKKLQKKAEMAALEVKKAGEYATFFQHQRKNLTAAEAQTAGDHVMRILGGFAALEDPSEGAALLLKAYRCAARRNETLEKIRALEGAAAAGRQTGRLLHRREALQKLADGQKQALDAVLAELQQLRQRYAGHPMFEEYEQKRDVGVDLSRLKYQEMRALRKDIQIIFQDPYSSLNPRMTVGQIIGEGLVTHRFFRWGQTQMKDSILQTMARCGLQAYMLHRYPHQFSGGQRQRICIARALAVKPKFVVCDECVSALDVSIQSQIINLLEELKRQENLTYLFISHDLSVVRYISDRIGVMYLGNLVELGTAEEIFADPRHPYTVALLSSIPSTDPNAGQRDRIILEGSIPSPIRPPEGCKFHTRCYMACDKCRRVPPQSTEVSPGHFVTCHFPERKMDVNGQYLFHMAQKEGNA